MNAKPITVETIDRSYQLMGLLAVCAHAASTINDVSNMSQAQVANGLANCLELAIGMASEQHDLLEMHARERTAAEVKP